MERRMMRGLVKTGALVLVASAFMVCSNPIDIVGNVSNEVKASHNMFLLISNASPAANSTVSPGSSISIKFDRSIDPSTATSDTITFNPAVVWDSSSYDSPSKTLTIVPAALDGGKSYTVTVTRNVRGTDGSNLQSDYVLTFSTRAEPYGTFKIQAPATVPDHDPAYTQTPAVTIVVSPNQLVDQMKIWEQGYSGGWQYKATSVPFTLSSGDGAKTIWIEFIDRDGVFTTAPISHVITMDTVRPIASSLSINGGATLINTTSVTLTPSGSDSNGLYMMRFLNSGSSWSAWEAYAATKAWTLATGDGSKTVSVQLSDKAGLTSSATPSASITLDTTPPNTPTVAVSSTSGTAMPTYSWSSGGGGGAGVYRYEITSVGVWSAETTALSWTPSSLEYGSNNINVQERDAAGNWSDSGATTAYFYYPSFLRPAYQATGVSRQPTFVFGTGGRYLGNPVWDLYGSYNPKRDGWTKLVENLTTTSYTMPFTLTANTRFSWYYVCRNTMMRTTYTSPPYYFTTGP